MIMCLLIWEGKIKMYFINIKQLKQDIINKKFSEKDRFIYVFIYIMSYAFFSELDDLAFIENPTAVLMSDYIYSIGILLITAIGTYYLYKANDGSEGEDFLGRYFSITWVVFIRLLFLIPIFIGVIIIIKTIFEEDQDILDIMFIVFDFIYAFLIYYCSYGHMVEVSKKVEE